MKLIAVIGYIRVEVIICHFYMSANSSTDISIKQTFTFDVIVSDGKVTGIVTCWSGRYSLQWFVLEPIVIHTGNSITYRMKIVLH